LAPALFASIVTEHVLVVDANDDERASVTKLVKQSKVVIERLHRSLELTHWNDRD
jgi:hypothetical protein